MESAHDILNSASALFQSLPAPTVSAKTEHDYRKTLTRMLLEGEVDPLRPGDARDTYNHRRAALHAGTWHLLNTSLRRYGKHTASGDAAGAVLELEQLKQIVTLLGPAIERDPPMDREGGSFSCPPSRWSAQPGNLPRRGKRSKKHDLSKLPAGWQQTLWNHAVSNLWRYLDALAVHMLTPVRPAEFVPRDENGRSISGVVIKLTKSGQIFIGVAPVKSHGGKYGTGVTSMTFDTVQAGGAAQHLAALCRSNGGTVTITLAGTNAVRKALQKLGAAVFPDLEFAITPYHFRHQCMADLKATVGAGETVATAAGHCTDRTQSRYGRVIHGRRRPGFLSSIALRPPKRGNIERARSLAESRRSPTPPGLP